MDTGVAHDKMGPTLMLAFESTASIVTPRWLRTSLECVDRNGSAGQGKVGRPGSAIRTLLWQGFSDHERLAQSIGDFRKRALVAVASEHAHRARAGPACNPGLFRRWRCPPSRTGSRRSEAGQYFDCFGFLTETTFFLFEQVL